MVFSRYTSILRVAGKTLGPRSFPMGTELLIKPIRAPIAKNVRYNSTQRSEKLRDSLSVPQGSPPSSLQLGGVTLKNDPAVSRDVDNFTFGEESDVDVTSDGYLYEDVKLPGALDRCEEDLSHVGPYIMPTFNFAAYANDSLIIQEFVKLGVDLHRVEKRPEAMELFLKRTWDDVKPYIRFLHDCGVPAQNLGKFLTKNPLFLRESLDDMATRIRYLRAHNFTADMVANIINKNPYWLMFDTKKIDSRLGYFQREYKLNGAQVRHLATKGPRLVTYKYTKLREINFAVREEMGFDDAETKAILLDKPRVFMKNRQNLVNVFDYIHNTMELSHKIIAKEPKILTCRLERLRQRHEYLKTVGRVQYDPSKPMYVSPEALVSGTDIEFCRNVAKTCVTTYNMYLKTL